MQQVFVIVAGTLFLPVVLETYARENGRAAPDFVALCAPSGLGGGGGRGGEGAAEGDQARCAVRVLGSWVDTGASRPLSVTREGDADLSSRSAGTSSRSLGRALDLLGVGRRSSTHRHLDGSPRRRPCVPSLPPPSLARRADLLTLGPLLRAQPTSDTASSPSSPSSARQPASSSSPCRPTRACGPRRRCSRSSQTSRSARRSCASTRTVRRPIRSPFGTRSQVSRADTSGRLAAQCPTSAASTRPSSSLKALSTPRSTRSSRAAPSLSSTLPLPPPPSTTTTTTTTATTTTPSSPRPSRSPAPPTPTPPREAAPPPRSRRAPSQRATRRASPCSSRCCPSSRRCRARRARASAAGRGRSGWRSL